MAGRALLPVDLDLQPAVLTMANHWLQPIHNRRWRGKPDRQIGPTHGQEWLRAEEQQAAVGSLGPAYPSARATNASAPGPSLAHAQYRWPTCPLTRTARALSTNRWRSR